MRVCVYTHALMLHELPGLAASIVIHGASHQSQSDQTNAYLSAVGFSPRTRVFPRSRDDLGHSFSFLSHISLKQTGSKVPGFLPREQHIEAVLLASHAFLFFSETAMGDERRPGPH